MILVNSSTANPYVNLAREEALLDCCGENQLYLYLWQNDKTVVIGRNQSALRECRIRKLEEDGGHLARRLSGGGAVYHDLGNLNFTFCAWHEHFDLHRQYEIIQNAISAFGIHAQFSGRNDLLIDGKKFSGSAYYLSRTACYHHGTLMVNVNLDNAAKYLSVSSDKLKSHGVDSVHSRMINLKSAAPGITIAKLKNELVRACETEYGLKAKEKMIDGDSSKYRSADWLYRHESESNYEISRKFDFGEVTIRFSLNQGKIEDIQIFTDAMTDEFSDWMKLNLTGCHTSEASSAIRTSGIEHSRELADLLEELT